MRYDVVTIGSSLEDVTFYTNECKLIKNKRDLLCKKMLAFEFGAKIGIEKIENSFGGGAANAAVSFSRLGMKTATICAIGKDQRGNKILKNFKGNNVETKYIQIHKECETGYSFILASSIHGSEHIVFPNRGSNNQLVIRNKEKKMLKNSTSWIYLTSLSGNWKSSLNEIFTSNKANIAWNIGSTQLMSGARGLRKYIERTKVLILNKDEALELAISMGREGSLQKTKINNTRSLIRAIMQLGPQITLITSGRRGSYVCTGKKIYHQPIHKEKRREDTTGAGDAFGSSFVTGLERYNFDIQKSLLLASKNSASVIGKTGAQNGLLLAKNVGLG